MEDGKVEISIDEQNKIRILDPEVYKESDKLKNECLELIKKILSFDENSKGMIESIEVLAKKKVDNMKLKALGEKSKLESVDESKKKRIIDLSKILSERESEFIRLENEYQSLLKIDQEQQNLIERLINNQMN